MRKRACCALRAEGYDGVRLSWFDVSIFHQARRGLADRRTDAADAFVARSDFHSGALMRCFCSGALERPL